MKHIILSLLSLLFITTTNFAQIVNCPLNTPEFPFETDDDLGGGSTYSWSAGLYMPAQLGAAHTINSISFRLDNTFGSAGTYNNVRVYLRHTAVTNYASSPGYPGTAGFTLVFNGNIAMSGTNGTTHTFTLSTPFAYNGTSNLEVLIENQGGHYDSAEPWFDRTNDAGPGKFPGKVGAGSSFANAIATSSNRQFNLAIFTGASNITFCGAYPLPVTFDKMDAKCEGAETILKWSTISEVNNDYFVIEQSVDGISWLKEREVDGKGTTTDYSSYEIALRNRGVGTNYYKLSQVDFDGKMTELQIVSSNCENTVIVAPNPTQGLFTLFSIERGSIIRVFDALGKEAINLIADFETEHLDLSSFSKGIYTVLVENKQVKNYLKIVKE